MRIVVTGGSGKAGRWVVRDLREHGHDVRNVDQRHDGSPHGQCVLADLTEVGLLLVDGPPKATGPRPRYPAVPLLADRLSATCTILVDDVARAEDREVTDAWQVTLPDFTYDVLPLRRGAAVLHREG